MNTATGANRRKDMIVINEKRVMLSKESCETKTQWLCDIPDKKDYTKTHSHWQLATQSGKRKENNAHYLFLNHDLFAKNITRLVCQIGSHCTPKTSPFMQKEKEMSYILVENIDYYTKIRNGIMVIKYTNSARTSSDFFWHQYL